MRLTITLLAVLLVMPAAVSAQQDVVFYDGFESGDTAGWWAPARVGKTGQVTCYDVDGYIISCSGRCQDGALQTGVAWPNPRFIDNGDGTVIDHLTGLVWLKDADCHWTVNWTNALTYGNTLASGTCGLTDGSEAGDWRLPSINELRSLLHYEYYFPALSNSSGTGQLTTGNPFTGFQSGENYWTSTWAEDWGGDPTWAWAVNIRTGVSDGIPKTDGCMFWPVREGMPSSGWAPDRVGNTGQMTCYDGEGVTITCTATGQDGDIRPGVPWPTPRFADNGDGTVTDMLTGLVWLTQADCFYLYGDQVECVAAWLEDGDCGLSDGSEPGDWRVPSIKELQSLVAYEFTSPALSDSSGTGQWVEGDAFSSVKSNFYWSSTSHAQYPEAYWAVSFRDGDVTGVVKSMSIVYMLPVRNGAEYDWPEESVN